MLSEIEDLAKKSIAVRPSGLTAIIHTVSDDISPIRVEMLDIHADYVNNIGDYIVLEVLIGLGTWTHDVYPYVNNLEVSLTYENIESLTIKTKRYKAVLLNDTVVKPESSGIDKIGKTDLDIKNIVQLKLQLIDRSLEVIRIKQSGTVFRNVTLENLLTAELSDNLTKLMVDGRPVIDELAIESISNKQRYHNLVIPDGTMVVSLPKYLHEKYGLYNAGVGLYFMDVNDRRQLYLYNTYNINKSETGGRVLKIIVDNDRPSSLSNKSFYIEANVVTISVGMDSYINNDGEARMMQDGAGFKTINSRAMMAKPVQMGEQPYGNRRVVNTEVLLTEREDGVNYAILDTNNNIFTNTEGAVKRFGVPAKVSWSYSDPFLLQPSMPVIVTYNDSKKTVIRKGVLLAHHTTINKDRVPVTTLNLFLERK